MEESILEFIGSELISVISPISICMFSVVLVSSLSSSSSSTQTHLLDVALVYAETPTDTTAAKLTGAVENAAVFILLTVVGTFLIFILYYYRFTNFLKSSMRFSTFLGLFSYGGPIFVSIIKHFSVRIDVFIYFLFLFNFSAVGVVALTGGGGVPIVVTQGYAVVLRIIAAAWLTQLPEWTTWVLLVATAVYDLVVVLASGGLLKIFLELEQSRNEDLPGLMYESRPRVRVSRDEGGGGDDAIGGLGMVGVSGNVGVEMQNLNKNDNNSENVGVEIQNLNTTHEIVRENEVGVERESERVALMSISSEIRVVSEERASPVEDVAMRLGIQLGLGDFTFYSVLMGRAAMYDLMTVFACYLAMLAGFACNLIILLAWRWCKPLPGLPIPTAFRIMFYFLTRVLMEPFVVQTSTNLLMF
ncbi:hypothetical protein RND81_06G111700 [Saponaria officinalis]|uniref:Presenilin n=1 Tax=Saponaria officinalis TaxID=3572 RepID=A0AAW1KBP4_SAPOF